MSMEIKTNVFFFEYICATVTETTEGISQWQAVRAHSRRSAHRKGEGGAHRWVRQRMCASY